MRRLVLKAFLIVTLVTSSAFADKQQCLTAHEDAQRLRSEGKMRAAREKLLICSADACPSLVKVDCTKWLPELDRELPTLIVRAKDGAGLDLVDATVELDGVTVAVGKAIGVDPGAHTLRVERAGKEIEQRVVIAAGEKNRIVEIVFRTETAQPIESASPLPWILAGVSVVGIAGFAAFGLSARGRLSELRDTCAPSCDPGEKRSIQTQLVLADVSLAIGVVSLGVATYLFLKPSKATTVAVSPGYASFSVVF